MAGQVGDRRERPARLSEWLAKSGTDRNAQLDVSLRLLCKWRSALIQNTVQQHNGTRICSGPFEGMDFLSRSTHGCHVSKLVGCYKQPLQPVIEEAIRAAYPVVVQHRLRRGLLRGGDGGTDAGHAGGCVRHRPGGAAPAASWRLKRGVADRVRVSARFTAADFAAYAGRKTLVLCDVEGAERELLDPAAAPALRGMDLIVESHDCVAAGTTRLLATRFQSTHAITVVVDSGERRLRKVPPWFTRLGHLDQLLATWEWRSGPTPWKPTRSRQAPGAAPAGPERE